MIIHVSSEQWNNFTLTHETFDEEIYKIIKNFVVSPNFRLEEIKISFFPELSLKHIYKIYTYDRKDLVRSLCESPDYPPNAPNNLNIYCSKKYIELLTLKFF